MRYAPIDPQLFVTNRRRLAEQCCPTRWPSSMPTTFCRPTPTARCRSFRTADLFYLTGVEQEESVLLLAPDAFDESLREVLFVRETNEQLQLWEGHKLTKEEATETSRAFAP